MLYQLLVLSADTFQSVRLTGQTAPLAPYNKGELKEKQMSAQQLKVTEVEFDFTTDDGDSFMSDEERKAVVDRVVGKVYEVEEDGLADVISDETGWCVLNLDYLALAPVKG